MSKPASISGRLTRSLTAVGLLGALLLLIFIGLEYRISFRHLSDSVAFHRAMHELAEHVLLPMVLLIVPMAMAGQWAIRQSMRPLIGAAGKIDKAGGEARGVRIDASGFPTETLPFAEAVNNLLDRVDSAAAMHEAFAADIAHELRTPLTLLSLQLDRLDHPEAPAMRADVAAMRRLIDQLMQLAQIDAERAAHMPPTEVDLIEVASEVIAQLAPAALTEGRSLELQGEAAGSAFGRREAIVAALRNLVENGLRVTPAGETVIVLADRPGLLAVRDGGPGLSPERLAIVSKRLRRADHASADGAGMGLAIVARIMAAHGGRLTTDPARRELRLEFPQA